MGKKIIYYGSGKGKSMAALGFAVQYAGLGESVDVIQCLKTKNINETNFLQRLEPEIKMFRFEKSECSFEDLSQEEKQEEKINIKNGLNFAKKVLCTGECTMLVLDEALGLIDEGIVDAEEIIDILQAGNEDTSVIITGRNMCEKLRDYVDEIYRIDVEK
ncbi:cob(I)alamin adenosyltransferase [Acetitomaculum ruminis DSM 5522]|uniref:Cob(I)alamin adenosyltransferase n=1 Tax=Acetitomaculum ruminis DSM 5522 TaxID=1120918 RepID=A0A1I0Z6R2_9FIRM|nr:cob(I)yrinic acid a,c-diamide adenosyltransferase [Acetitomaculum ruminis]SFB21047.1 cob(I)alamin adenosyltransferase [Acetitomaculum ruminis DSM 5522]